MFSLLYVTCPDKENAMTIARTLLAERLVACANVSSPVQSLYWWNGEIEESTEVVLLLKTEKKHVEAVIAGIKALHPYSCPCVLDIAISGGNPDFLRWIAEETL